MKSFSTSRCHERNHAEFSLRVMTDGIADSHIESMLVGIESMVQTGSVFRAGQTFQYGWMLTLVQELGDGLLTLHEPDMRSMPINFVPGVTETIRHMMLQLFTLDSFAIGREQMDIPTVCQSGIACNRYKIGEGFIMERATPSDDNDSGWFVGCNNSDCDHNDASNLQRLSLFEVFLARPEIRDWVSFPIGTLVQRHGKDLSVYQDGRPLEIVVDSFVDQALRRPQV